MELFWRLVLGHLISDFTLQTNYIAAWKRESKWGLLVHCAIHPVLYSILLWRYMGQTWVQVGPVPLAGWACIALIFITHFIEDQWRIWSVLKRGAPDNSFFYIWDQVIHYAVLFAMAPVVAGATSKFGFLHYPSIAGVVMPEAAADMGLLERFFTVSHGETWVFIGILTAIITHFTTVSIYFIEKDLFGAEFPADDIKYISMAERLIVMLCFLLPGYWWGAVVAFWILRIVIYKKTELYRLTWTAILMGNFMAIACGVLARTLIYSS